MKKRSKSPQRVLMERLSRAGLKPRAWAVAQVLEGYARLERGTRNRIASVYHAKIADITGMSIGNVRKALRELTTGPAALYLRRNTTGQRHTIYGTNDWELTTTGAIYEWIDASVTQGGPSTPAPARPGPERGRRRGRKADVRCLTPSQVEQFAADLEADPGYGEMVGDGQKRVAEYHALHRHVIERRCRPCLVAVAGAMAEQFPETFLGVSIDACTCGAPIARGEEGVFNLGEFISREVGVEHQCDIPESPPNP